MAFSRLVFTVLLLSVSCYASNVPVFLWGETVKTLRSSALQTVNAEEFEHDLKKELADAPLTVVFSEETLSVEDFSLKNSDGETAFPYLHKNLKDSVYLASVEDPLSVLEDYDGLSAELTENGLSVDLNTVEGRFLFISLADAKEGESRFDLLRRHDAFIQETIAKLEKDNYGLVSIYTARQPSWVIPETYSRVRRQAETQDDGVYHLDGLLIYAKSFSLQDGDNIVQLEGVPTATSNFNETYMNTTLTFRDTSVIFNFRQSAGYWFFDSVSVNPTTDRKELTPTVEVYALINFSYRCGLNVSFTGLNSTHSFHIEDLKVQPFFKSTSNETLNFGDSFNCVGFFSAPIWSGLFVVFILLAITFYGIMMMMDIKTMDRFDDPKGKTITINAAE